MSGLRAALRVGLAIVVWWAVVYPALAIFGAFVLPPDPFTQLFVVVPGLVLAVIAALVFVYRSGSLRQLGRFAVAVFVVFLVIGVPINVFFQLVGGVGLLLSVLTALMLVGISYGGGYYLIYENGYKRAKARYVNSGSRE